MGESGNLVATRSFAGASGVRGRDTCNTAGVPTWRELFESYAWRPIGGCPGRFTLAGRVARELPPSEAFGLEQAASVHDSAGARDRVFVVALAEGGLISYRRADGSFVHTLNTPEGFARKLAQLEIRLA